MYARRYPGEGGSMKLVEMYSVAELLATPTFKHNDTKLSKFLKVSRATLAKNKDDIECENHCVLKIDDGYYFKVTPSRRGK